ncbi:sterol desaturase family protein [Pseudoroseomonas cervicalis]|uniref:Fatty acid hydroxylase superfamily n=1 Tax=Pseudoroseomonas cervicalis ATCC 49957 TaxID=525371 RepID=D5RGQ1_9PROT|nr:sterol desaturase family protein [Pseudoroseomonas cervicalis]EFH13518.1 fatty acid hydroxylase superfamily [Pseudoroseomonas cervicalis ATCC 49957]
MWSALQDGWDQVNGWIFETLVQPALFSLGLMEWAEDAFEWIDFALFGLLQVVIIYLVCRPLEAWKPVEPRQDRRSIRTDIFYTLLTRLGLLPLVAFILFASVEARLSGMVADSGWIPPTLETMFPILREWPLLALCVYIVVLDFGEYWRHRFQHMFGWWWALHSIHHAQRQMTFWTDDRNHIIDDVLGAIWFGAIALAIGVPPGHFPIVVVVLRVAESLSHANVRLSFGRVGERLFVSPRFHRLHHGELGSGESGKNFAVLLPVWDWIFGTADFRRDVFPRTGDPALPEAMATGGWLRQQWIGLRRMGAALIGR